MNALCLRSGPELFLIATLVRIPEHFTLSDTARRAAKRRHGRRACSLMFYDAVGVGAGIRGPLNEWICPYSRAYR